MNRMHDGMGDSKGRGPGRGVVAVLAGALLTLAPLSGASAQWTTVDVDRERGEGQTRATYVVTVDDDVVRVESDGQTARVSLNGRDVDTLDLDERWSRFEVRGDEGEVVATILRRGNSGELMVFAGDAGEGDLARGLGGGGAWAWSGDDAESRARIERLFAAAGDAERPRVMIGITATNADTDDLRGVDADPDAVTKISTVVEDGPAARAGIRPGDVILSINDRDAGNLKAIREVLSDKEPGQTVSVVVLRDGDRRRYTLELDAFRSEAFSSQSLPRGWAPMAELGVAEIAELREEIERRSAELGDLASALAGAGGQEAAEIRQQMALVSREIAEMSQKIARQSVRSRLGGIGDVEVEIFGDDEDGKRRMVFVPQPPRPPSLDSVDELERRFERLSDQLDEKLDRFEARMGEMEDELDRKLDELVDELLRRMRERAE